MPQSPQAARRGAEIAIDGDYICRPWIVAYPVPRGMEYERVMVPVDAHGKMAREPQVAHYIQVTAASHVEPIAVFIAHGIGILYETQLGIRHRHQAASHRRPVAALIAARAQAENYVVEIDNHVRGQ